MAFDLSIVGKPSDVSRFTYSWKDVVLYALGIGAKTDELDFLYEGASFGNVVRTAAGRPKVIPSFIVVPTFPVMLAHLAKTGGDLAMVVHGAQRFRVHKPLAPSGELSSTATIRGIYDMRKFASVLVDTHTRDEQGLVAEGTWTIIYRNHGGFGGEPPPKEPSEIAVPKDREPDFRIEEKTAAEQALLYRLSGDPNPLHADPEFAKKVGFEQGPILHGLCTYGFMVRHVAKGACAGDATKLTGIDGRFSKPVWPGDTIVTQGWVVAPGKVALTVSVKEREETVITAASATFAS
jgi:acyl dehydratase